MMPRVELTEAVRLKLEKAGIADSLNDSIGLRLILCSRWSDCRQKKR